MVKNLPAMQEIWVQSLCWEIPWRREWQPTPVFLPGEFHGHRSLVGYIQSMGSQRVSVLLILLVMPIILLFTRLVLFTKPK